QTVSFVLYAALLASPISSLASVYGQTLAALESAARLRRVMWETPEPIESGGRALAPVRGDIRFHCVSFAYPGREPALSGFSLHIRGGEKIALTGFNGAGKSTVVHLLMRLIEPSQGRILIDGQPIAEVNLHSLRGQIGLVSQNVLLFNASVRDNIAYGRPDA